MSGINWGELERRGLIKPTPGREEATAATYARLAEKKAQQASNKPKQAKSK